MLALTAEALLGLAQAGGGPVRPTAAPAGALKPLTQRFTADEQTALVERYRAGESAASVAREFEVATSALTSFFRAQSVVVRSAKRLSAEQEATLRAEYEAGSTMRELEARHGLSHGVVYRALRETPRDAANLRTGPTSR